MAEILLIPVILSTPIQQRRRQLACWLVPHYYFHCCPWRQLPPRLNVKLADCVIPTHRVTSHQRPCSVRPTKSTIRFQLPCNLVPSFFSERTAPNFVDATPAQPGSFASEDGKNFKRLVGGKWDCSHSILNYRETEVHPP